MIDDLVNHCYVLVLENRPFKFVSLLGVGDNFGRSVYMDDSHSINSFSDDFALSLPPERDLQGGVPMNILMTTSISGRSNISRSTGKVVLKQNLA